MTDNFEKKVAVDGPVVNAGELGSSTFSPGQALPAGPLGLGQRWTVARKREVVLRLRRTLQCPVDRRKERLPEPRSSSSGVARRDLNQARRVRQICVQGTGCATSVHLYRARGRLPDGQAKRTVRALGFAAKRRHGIRFILDERYLDERFWSDDQRGGRPCHVSYAGVRTRCARG